ncbi:hypothetical protein D3C74_389590 [compost metagenome]
MAPAEDPLTGSETVFLQVLQLLKQIRVAGEKDDQTMVIMPPSRTGCITQILQADPGMTGDITGVILHQL